MASGISGQVVSATLIALPMKVRTAGLSVAQVRIEEFELQHDDRKQREQNEAAVFHILGGLPVVGSLGTQPGKRGVDTLRVEARDQVLALLHHRRARIGFEPALEIRRRSRSAAPSSSPVSLCCGGCTNEPI